MDYPLGMKSYLTNWLPWILSIVALSQHVPMPVLSLSSSPCPPCSWVTKPEPMPMSSLSLAHARSPRACARRPQPVPIPSPSSCHYPRPPPTVPNPCSPSPSSSCPSRVEASLAVPTSFRCHWARAYYSRLSLPRLPLPVGNFFFYIFGWKCMFAIDFKWIVHLPMIWDKFTYMVYLLLILGEFVHLPLNLRLIVLNFLNFRLIVYMCMTI